MAQAEFKLQDITFSKAVRGYSCEEVDTYLAHVNDQFTALAKECIGLRRKMAAMAAGQNEYREDALREKEKIAAEAQSLIDAGKAAADKLVEDARRKAARLLADAETAAAGILKQAEEAAAKIPAAEAEPAFPASDVSASDISAVIAQQNNVADRLVEEIDSFREEIFAMYARHIEELERLSQLTDNFYETKEALTAGYRTAEMLPEADDAEGDMPETEPDDMSAGNDADDFVPDYGEDDASAFTGGEAEDVSAEEDEDPLAAFYENDEDDDFLRIDWKAHHASLDAEPVTPESTEAFRDFPDADDGTEAAAADLPGFPEPDGEDMFAEPEEAGEADVLDSLFASDDDDEDDLLAQTYASAPSADFPEEEPAEAISADDEEAFFSGIADEYLTPKKPAQAPAAKKTAAPESKRKTGTLDDLFDEETTGGLTGEFEFIYNSKKSADNVAQIRRQPLVDAQKPEKPKKHQNR